MPRPLVMGVVNVTPDSFSDGGRYVEPRAAVAHGLGGLVGGGVGGGLDGVGHAAVLHE